ncbi:MAG: ABC transporter ATP-binding protein [Holophaga sp.]|jgi:subfamily B ATP-binding cassette protein MsbA
MSSFLRFFREHLKRQLPLIAGGSLLLSLAGACQGIQIGILRLVFSDVLAMGSTVPAAGTGSLDRIKAWVIVHMPAGSHLREEIYLISLALVLIFVVKGILTYSGTLLMVRSGVRATLSLRERMFSHLLGQEPAYFQRHPVGELLQRCISDVGAVQGIASNQFADAVRELTVALAMLVTILVMNWRLSMAMFIAGPLVVWPLRKLSRRIRSINHRNMEASGRLLQRLKEVFSNIRVVLGFAREPFEEERFRLQNNELFRLAMKSARAQAAAHPIMELVGGVLLAALLIYTNHSIRNGAMTGPGLCAYIFAVYAFYDPLRRLTKLNADVQVAQASLDRVYSVLDRQTRMVQAAHPVPVPAEPRRLAFEDVHFAYDGKRGRSEVLRGINLEVRKGETVALVGGSGGGKTTLVNLVPRYFDPTAGRVTLDGVDVREFDVRELRRRIGIVTQETLLFLDSVHDNIAYGLEADREAVVEAARKAHAHDFITALRQGYDTPLAETGSTLSGGQRQRLAIARALLQDPPILILDEATSALDTESERAVQEALEVLMRDRTTLVIAHRLSTIQRATRICVLHRGEVVEMGPHEELLARKGEYDRLYQLQFRS